MSKNPAAVRTVALAAALVLAVTGCATLQSATASPLTEPVPAAESEPVAEPTTPSVSYALASVRIAHTRISATPDDLAIDPETLRKAAVVHTAEGDDDDKEAADPGVLTVRVVGLRNHEGVVRIAVYNSGDGFPKSHNAVVDDAQLSISGGADSVETTFDLEPGTYAVAILHDENQSGGMDYNGLGMPTEGYGASNNPSSSLSGPSWNDSKFELGDHKIATIKVLYF